MKKAKITYNPKGLKRADNVGANKVSPANDISLNDIIIKKEKGHYWKIEKKK